MKEPSLEESNLDVDELAVGVLRETEDDRIENVLNSSILDGVVHSLYYRGSDFWLRFPKISQTIVFIDSLEPANVVLWLE